MVEENVSKAFGCSYCTKKFSIKQLLRRHINTVHHNETHFCPKCDNEYSTKDNLRRHLKAIHKVSGENLITLINSARKIFKDEVGEPFTCSMCNKKFRDKLSLNRHLAGCTESGSSSSNEDKSRNSIISSNNKMKSNNYKKSLKRALLVTQAKIKKEAVEHVEEDNSGKLQCNDCGKIFGYKSNLNAHIRKVQCITKCNQCGSKFQTSRILQEHIRSKHLGLKVPCNNCDSLFSSKSNLWRHINKGRCKNMNNDKTPIKEVSKSSKSPPKTIKPKTPKADVSCTFACEKCSYKSDTEFNLRRHKINRHYDFLFTCNYCKFHTFDENDLEPHCIAIHEEQIKFKISKQTIDGNDNRLSESGFYCDLCSFETREENTLTNHLALQHYNDIMGK